MNKNQITGRVKAAKGKGKEIAGKAVGNKRLELKGAGQKLVGRAEAAYGDVKNDVDGNRKCADRITGE